MAKISKPAPKAPATDAATIAAPQVDIAPLMASLAPAITKMKDGDTMKDEGILDAVIEIRGFREANEGVERDQIRTCVQQVVAETYGLKIDQVAKKPDDTLKKSKPADYAVRNSCYTLVSQLLGVAWAKDEKRDAAVTKALEKGERRFTVLVKTAQKPSTRVEPDPNANKITKENFATKFTAFCEKALADIGAPATIDEIHDLVETTLEAAKAAPKD